MRVAHVSHSDINGGAARASYRLHTALRSLGVESRMVVNARASGDWSVEGPASTVARVSARIRPWLGGRLAGLARADEAGLRSLAVMPGSVPERLRGMSPDITHLHWVNGEMLSVAQIGRLRGPVVWTLHDMWPFCGARHYETTDRWQEGYQAGKGARRWPDLDRWVSARKNRHWRRPFHVVAPSQWLADCVRKSALMREWPVTVIPNAIDLRLWRPMPQETARDILGLPRDAKLLLFGAMGGTSDPRKGGDLLFEALGKLARSMDGVELVIFGQSAPKDAAPLAFPAHYMGSLSDEVALKLLYGAADAFVLPSRQDNLPNTGVEAAACGRPVVAFDLGGMPDIVDHQRSGYLAKAFDTDDLARGLAWVLSDGARWSKLCRAAEERATERFAAPVVAQRHASLYRDLLEGQRP